MAPIRSSPPIKRLCHLTFAALLTLSLISTPLLAQSAADKLISRAYQLDLTEIQEFLPAPTPGQPQTTPPSPTQKLQTLFSNAGVDFPAKPLPADAPHEKAFFFNDRTGELHIRATRRDFPKIEPALSVLLTKPPQPPQVSVETKLVEFSRTNPPEILTNYLSSDTNLRPTIPGRFRLSILTEKQFRSTLHKLENTEDVDLITPPGITTISGRQARISIEETRTFMYQTPPPFPWDTAPDANPTPLNKGRLPFHPPFTPTASGLSGALIIDNTLLIRADSDL